MTCSFCSSALYQFFQGAICHNKAVTVSRIDRLID
jgi:hypothetical protein